MGLNTLQWISLTTSLGNIGQQQLRVGYTFARAWIKVNIFTLKKKTVLQKGLYCFRLFFPSYKLTCISVYQSPFKITFLAFSTYGCWKCPPHTPLLQYFFKGTVILFNVFK